MQKAFEQHIFRFQAGFWVIAYALRVLIHFFSYGSLTGHALANITISHGFQIVLVYIHLWLLVSMLMQQKRKLAYLGLLVIAMAVVTLVKVGFKGMLGLSLMGGYHEVWQFLTIAAVYGSILTAVKFFRDEQRSKELEYQLQEAERDRLSAELKSLKAQIHPHFLFNTLNNIYSLSLRKSDKTSEYILMLSELMSYVLYDANNRFVALEKELHFIEHYIALERIRLDKDQRIECSIPLETKGHQIAPLLLIPLVENAFKHGAKGSGFHFKLEAGFLEEREGDTFYFHCENSTYAKPFEQQTNRGVGLNNLVKRLERLYPNQHTLEVDHQEEVYRVHLSLQLWNSGSTV